MTSSYVYVHYRLGTEIPFYVGKGSSKCRHRSRQSRNRYWHFIVKKDGGFIAKKVVENVDDDMAYLAEVELIDKFKRLNYKLVNMTEGGEGHLGLKVRLGATLSDETKEKLRQANLGKKQSLETIQKRKETIKRIGFKPTPKLGFGPDNYQFKGGYITPNGVFDTLDQCALANDCTVKKVRINLYGNKCKVQGKMYFYPPKEGWSLKVKD